MLGEALSPIYRDSGALTEAGLARIEWTGKCCVGGGGGLRRGGGDGGGGGGERGEGRGGGGILRKHSDLQTVPSQNTTHESYIC